jgi:hypothetical protein
MVGISRKGGKHLHDRIISLRGVVWAHKTSFTHPLYYSISSSAEASPGEIDVTVEVLEYRTGSKKWNQWILYIGDFYITFMLLILVSDYCLIAHLPLNSLLNFKYMLWAPAGQTKENDIGIFCFSAKHASLRSKSKNYLIQNQNNVSDFRG